MDSENAWSVMTSLLSGITVLLDFLKSALGSLAWPATVMTGMWLFRKDIVLLLSKIAAIKAGGFEASFAHQLQTMEPLDTVEPSPADESNAEAVGAAHPEQAKSNEEDAESSVRHPDLSPDIDLELRRATESLLERTFRRRRARDSSALDSLSPLARRDFKEARLVASNSPSAAVLLAWRAVDGILRDIGLCLELGDTVLPSATTSYSPRGVMRSLYRNGHIDSDVFDRYHDLVKLRNEVAHAQNFAAKPDDVEEYIDRAQELGVTLSNLLKKIEQRTTRQVPSPQGDLALFDGRAPQE